MSAVQPLRAPPDFPHGKLVAPLTDTALHSHGVHRYKLTPTLKSRPRRYTGVQADDVLGLHHSEVSPLLRRLHRDAAFLTVWRGHRRLTRLGHSMSWTYEASTRSNWLGPIQARPPAAIALA